MEMLNLPSDETIYAQYEHVQDQEILKTQFAKQQIYHLFVQGDNLNNEKIIEFLNNNEKIIIKLFNQANLNLLEIVSLLNNQKALIPFFINVILISEQLFEKISTILSDKFPILKGKDFSFFQKFKDAVKSSNKLF